jgi:hybrid cluster-associated redox disulfide protein
MDADIARSLMPGTPTIDTTIAELLQEWPAARVVLAKRGMACVGCAMARFETVSEAARAYGFDAARLIDDVRRADRRAGARARVPRRPAARRRVP